MMLATMMLAAMLLANLAAPAAWAQTPVDAKAAQAGLPAKFRNGGQGVWGAIPMPPNPGVSDDEMKQLPAWILSQD